VSFSSRSNVGLNSVQERDCSQLRYIEVTNAEHFDTDLPSFDTWMVPLPGTAPPLDARNVPQIPAQPRSEDRITVHDERVIILD
jgi:hydroxybutyrate-dimer hydrolase